MPGVSQSTLEHQPPGRTPSEPAPPGGIGPGIGALLRRPALPIAAGLLAISTLIVLWAHTRPGFDPYGWLVWGRETIVGSLNTNAAPSWKPLPYLFTAPYAVFGHYQLWLWMITSVAISLSGVLFAGRIAYRLTDAAPERRYAGIVAAVFAGASLLGIRDYAHYVLSSQSDPIIVTLCLAAIDAHLSGRPRWAFALAALASLGRPEVWPFAGLYALWAWRTIPSMRWLIGTGVAANVLLWFGIPALTSRSPFVAGTNALGSGRALHSNKVFGTVDRFLGLHETALELLAVLSVGLAAVRRDRVTLAISAAAVAWVVLEIAFALHGWPGLPRYMFEAAAVMTVVAAVGVGRLLAGPPRLTSAYGVAGLAIVVVGAGAMIPGARSRERIERRDLRVQRLRTDEINRLAGVISRLGGAARLRGCGEPLTRLEYQTVLAWQLRVNVATVGFKYGPAIRSGRPIVLFTPTRRGWKAQAFHQRAAGCRGLPR
jgi:hypothetical protein